MLRRRWIALLLPWLVLLVFPLAAGVRPATASNAVVNSPCLEAQFDAALAAVQTSGGGTITFNCGGAANIATFSAKTITSTVTIEGADLITLDAGLFDQHFIVDPAGRLTLKHLTLTGGYALVDGGAIDNDGVLVIEHSTLRGNQTVTGRSGGAIVSTGPVTITDSLFEGNQSGGGGALYVRFAGARTYVRNTIFRDNHALGVANGWGGAILSWDGATVLIEGGAFYTNTAKDGGAIYNTYPVLASTLRITGTLFQENHASLLQGGALYNAGVLYMTGGAFVHNTITHTGFTDAAGGGLAIDVNGVASLTGVNFEANTAAGKGGGLSNQGVLVMTGGSLSANHAADLGGGAYITNSADISGTAVSGNTAFRGGAFFLDRGYLVLTNLTVAGNASINHGGGLYSQGIATLNDVTFQGNQSNTSGGGLYLTSNSILWGNTFVNRVRLIGNSAADGGGLYTSAGYLNIAASTISGNHAERGGGVSGNTSILLIQRSAIFDNQAVNYGGGLALNFANATLENVTISGNSAHNTVGSGGGVRTFSTGPTLLRNVTIANNSAATGGGLRIDAGPQPLTFTNSIVDNSLAGGNCSGSAMAGNYSLSSDLTCFLNGTNNISPTNPLLTGLGYYGGPTPAHMLKIGSPALDSVSGSDAPSVDQRNLGRPVGSGYDRGAIERQPSDVEVIKRLFLPFTRR